MKAVVLDENGVSVQNVDKPNFKANQVLIKTRAVSLNPVDYKVTQGAFSLDRPRIIGIDVAGEISEIGKEVKGFVKGERVFALVNIFETGSFADFVAVDAILLSRIPENVTYEQAATIPCAGLTAWQAINQKINLKQNQSIFITGGNGAVGQFAIQLAKLKKAKVYTSASKSFDSLKTFDVDGIINYKNENVEERLMQLTEFQGVDYIINSNSALDIIGTSAALKFNGIIVGIAGIPKEYPYQPFSKAAGIIEIALVAAYNQPNTSILKQMAEEGEKMAHLISSNEVVTSKIKTISFENIPENLKLFGSGNNKHKIVATLPS